MLFQLPVTAETWQPLSPSEFIDSATSVALTIPNPQSQSPPAIMKGRIIYVAFMMAVAQTQWVRLDGNPATVTGCIQLDAKDTLLIYGLTCLKAVRVIHGAALGGLSVSYFYYQQEP